MTLYTEEDTLYRPRAATLNPPNPHLILGAQWPLGLAKPHISWALGSHILGALETHILWALGTHNLWALGARMLWAVGTHILWGLESIAQKKNC